MLSEASIQNLADFRRMLHANPEVSGEEFETQKRILEYLKAETNAEVIEVANTGVMAIFEGNSSGSTIMIRGDIDALPITEINEFEHKSKNEDVSHKCGHDGHTTILLGLAKVLNEKPLQSGRVLLLFQPAEEDGMGADAVLADENFKKEAIDYVFALHNLPGYEKNQLVIKENEFTANVTSIIIKLNGKTSHAAEPELGNNPGTTVSKLLAYANLVTNNNPAADDFFLMTPVYATLGETAYGISAGYGEVHFTIRSWSTDLMKKKNKELVEYIHSVCNDENIQPDISWTQVFHANINHPEAVNLIRNAAEHNNMELVERDYPFKWGEDFGSFTQKHKGAMFGIGAGVDTPALHNPDYDFPDDILLPAIHMFHQIIMQKQ